MPTRVHAKMLITQLERAESVVKDLFMEATDDGIEALEAVLAACCREVMETRPQGSRDWLTVADDAAERRRRRQPRTLERSRRQLGPAHLRRRFPAAARTRRNVPCGARSTSSPNRRRPAPCR